ncbi:adenosylcobinamide-GDP ribazoletransferase [Profundibacter sp.]|uniref:adenosylcobinamide-GDP ribazoletransferase n=1 Tax=Profundibacter sp. TaxID=3101071 RepID=UPI003D129776
MIKPDTPLIRLADIPAAIGLLTRLPVKTDGARGAAAAWAFPLVGLIVGALAASIGWLALELGLSAQITAALVITAQVVMTGAMHEDGLADTFDGLWGGWDMDRRLEIMKDSQIGTYGVIALVMSLLLRWSAITVLIHIGALFMALIATATLSRMPMVLIMATLPHARDGGLSASVGRVGKDTAGVALGLALLACFIAPVTASIIALIAASIAASIIALIALRKIGGQTGDILGASQQLAEIAVLLTFTTLLT